jgi:hypothetical protein
MSFVPQILKYIREELLQGESIEVIKEVQVKIVEELNDLINEEELARDALIYRKSLTLHISNNIYSVRNTKIPHNTSSKKSAALCPVNLFTEHWELHNCKNKKKKGMKKKKEI